MGRSRDSFSKIRKKFIIVVLVVAAVMIIHNLFFQGSGFFGLFKTAKIEEQMESQKEAEKTEESQGQPTPIKAFVVAQFDFKDFLNALGTLKGGLEFKLSFEIPGIVESINYHEGEKYESGALLISLKQADILLRLKRSESKMKKAETNEQIFKQKLEEHEKLFSIGAIPKTTLEKARLEYEGAQYEREDLSFQVRADEIILEKSNLYAPSAGMIGELNVEVGEAVTSNTLLGSHVLTEFVKAEFGVIERDVAKIAIRQEAKVQVDAYQDRTFTGVVDSVAPIIVGQSRTASAEVKIDNSEGLLLPGMFARIQILLFERDSAIVLPTEAIVEEDGSTFVYRINRETNMADKVNVAVAYSQTDYSVVDSGVQQGDLVAISSLDKLKQDAKVDVLETQKIQVDGME